jgi:hypothetical protein
MITWTKLIVAAFLGNLLGYFIVTNSFPIFAIILEWFLRVNPGTAP